VTSRAPPTGALTDRRGADFKRILQTVAHAAS
jgi:hypothetical protein